MNREDLDKLPINKLKAIIAELNLNCGGGRLALIDRIADHYELTGWSSEMQAGEVEEEGASTQISQEVNGRNRQATGAVRRRPC